VIIRHKWSGLGGSLTEPLILFAIWLLLGVLSLFEGAAGVEANGGNQVTTRVLLWFEHVPVAGRIVSAGKSTGRRQGSLGRGPIFVVSWLILTVGFGLRMAGVLR
jgi:hypothetical protein